MKTTARMNKEQYHQLISRVRDSVSSALPNDATLIVISKGDEDLLKLGGRPAWHFPQLEDGSYAGYTPAKSEDAIAQLEVLRDKGGDFLIVPATAFWWFDHYVGFKEHLESHYRIVACERDTCAVFSLRQTPSKRGAIANAVTLARAMQDAPASAPTNGHGDKARQIIRTVEAAAEIAIEPTDSKPTLELARLDRQHGRLSAAEGRLTTLLDQEPSDRAVVNELMELFCCRVEAHGINPPGDPVDRGSLKRLLAQLKLPERHKLISADTHLTIAETLAGANRVEPALASLTSALNQLDFSLETLRGFAARLLRPVVNNERVIPFHDSCSLAAFLTQMGNGFTATHEAYKAQACYYLALAADRESWAARFNLAFLDVARGDVLGVLQHLKGTTDIAPDQAALIAWPAAAARVWPQGVFDQGDAFEKVKPAGKPWPKITVITPSFNQREVIEETLLSVLNQAYPALEYVVVDGASTDGTRQVLRRYGKRITKLIMEPDGGRADAINKGLDLATGDLVLWLDAGDMLAPGALFMVALSHLEERADLVTGFCLEHCNHHFHSISRSAVTQATFNVECLGKLDEHWLGDNDFYRSQVAFSRRILDKVGAKLDNDLTHAMDYEFWMRCAAAGGRLSVTSWPIGLRRQAVQKHADLTTRILEQCRVRDRFVVPEPSLERQLEIRQRLGWVFAQTVPEIAVVSTRASTVFSPGTARELKETFAGEGLSVSFHDNLEAAAHGGADLIILLVHLSREREALHKLRETGYQGPIVGWFWDNHYLIQANFDEAKDLDICIPGHAFAADYLRSRQNLLGAATPLCTTQWSREEAAKLIRSNGLKQRNDVLFGDFVQHSTARERNAFVQEMLSAGTEGISFLDEDALQRYFAMPPDERFKIWASHKVSLCLPQNGNLSQRLFDALLSGQIPIVPDDVHDLDTLIPRHVQKRLPLVRLSEYSPAAVREAHAAALELFDSGGRAGILRRHRFALNNHVFATRIAAIISATRATAEIYGTTDARSFRTSVNSSWKTARPNPCSPISPQKKNGSAHELPAQADSATKTVALDKPFASLRNPCASPEMAESDPSMRRQNHSFLLSSADRVPPLPGVSLVTGCMNREENLLKVLPSWLATDAMEIVIVDWSSDSDLSTKLSSIADPRLKVIRIDGEKSWVLAHALNVGLRFASHELVFKLDCDIELSPNFLNANAPQTDEFVRGFWRSGLAIGGEGQQFINGTFGAFKRDLREANYYDERILTYGWDDSDLYSRLSHDLGLAAKQIDPGSLRHLEQPENQRIAHQNVSRNRFLGMYEPTEFEGAKNKFYATIEGGWNTSFISQDYELTATTPGIYRGHRVTERPKRRPESEQLAELLASRQLLRWAASSVPSLGGADAISLGLAKAFRDAHRADNSAGLLAGFTQGNRVCLIHCEPGPCQVAMRRTLAVLQDHYPQFRESLIVAEGGDKSLGDGRPAGGLKNVLMVEPELLAELTEKMHARTVATLDEFVAQVIAGDAEALSLALSIASIAEQVCRHAEVLRHQLTGTYQAPANQVPGSCLVTSLYDEQNILRLIEYLTCIVLNLKIFERIVIYYESSTGILSHVLQKVIETLNVPTGCLLVLPFPKRPTFEELFSIETMLPEGSLVAVANADVAFDASFSKVKQIDLSRNIVVLSRRDVINNGRSARLIRLANGVPNTFSADAWVVATPFEYDFFLDYPLGSFHCDSFINHQISRSSRYNVVNPCLDVAAFHLHDERFNSSAEKQKRDAEIIQGNYGKERERNDNVDPIRGVSWMTAAGATVVPNAVHFQCWKPKGLFLQVASSSKPVFGHLLLLHFILTEFAETLNDVVVVVRLRKSDLEGALGRLLLRYGAHFGSGNVLLDVDDTEFDSASPMGQVTFRRSLTFADLAEWITTGALEKGHDFLAWPAAAGIEFLRCEVTGSLSTDQTASALAAMEAHLTVLPPLIEFFKTLPEHSAERKLITPFIASRLLSATRPSPKPRKVRQKPSVSFITSLFNGGTFLPGFLENVVAAAQQVGGEIIIVDANPDDRDARVINEYLAEHPLARKLIDYVRLDRDPGLYECWRIAIDRARAGLITNANIDDRRCPLHTARLVQLLNEHPEYAGACGSISCVNSDGPGDWFTLCDSQLWFFDEGLTELALKDLYKVNDRGEVMSRNVMHCMPVWRKSLHKRYGYFDEETYGTSADWAFWLKCAKAGEKFLFERSAFGRYFLNPKSHNRRNDPDGAKERRILRDFLGVDQTGFVKQ